MKRLDGSRGPVAAISPAATPLTWPGEPSGAAPPFTHLSGEPERESLADGPTWNIITGRSRLTNLLVTARNRVLA